MKAFSAWASGLCLALPLAAGAAATGSLKGKVYPAEQKTLIAKESGFEVSQRASSPTDDSGLYFTSQSFVPDDACVVFTNCRAGNGDV